MRILVVEDERDLAQWLVRALGQSGFVLDHAASANQAESFLASDQYDARGQLYRAGFAYMAPSYDLPAPYTDMFSHYDLVAGIYSLTGFIAETDGLRHTKPLSEREWSADSLAGAGIR